MDATKIRERLAALRDAQKTDTDNIRRLNQVVLIRGGRIAEIEELLASEDTLKGLEADDG